jgi:lysyl-tRNA synthetase class 2
MSNSNQLPNINDEYEIRLAKVNFLRAKGIEPWPIEIPVITHFSSQLKSLHEKVLDESFVEKVTIAGRILTKRAHGKAAFFNVQDQDGIIQIYLNQAQIGQEDYNLWEHVLDVGDIISTTGTLFITKVGELTVRVDRLVLLSKSLHPLPEKFHGLTDVETRYRQRYLDLISNPDTKERFKKRSGIISMIRQYLFDHGYMEVETPMLHPIPGGAAAKPFVTHHNALSNDFYLRIAPELYLKRLLVGGYDRVFEINRNFRNEGVSTRHNPEFTMLEFYTAFEDFPYAINFVEHMLRYVVQKVCGQTRVPFGEHILDFESPFAKLTVFDAICQYGGYNKADIQENEIDNLIKKLGIKLANKEASYGQKLFAVFEEVAEKKLIQPTFLIGFPIEVSPLAKRNKDNNQIADRFELFMAGMELANSFNELNDPLDQAERFKDQAKAHAAGDDEAHHYDADFIKALEYGLPPAVGVGVGIDRLVMCLTNTTSIKDVILFPTLKKIQS